MAIIQTGLEVSDELLEKINSGEYIRYAGVVRDKAGHLVKYLPEVKTQSTKGGKIIIVSAILGVGTAIGIGIEKVIEKKRRKKKEQLEINPLLFEIYDTSIKNYIESIEKKKLDSNTIIDLLKIIRTLKSLIQGKSGILIIDLDKTNLLFDCIYDYTLKLASENKYNIDFEDMKEIPTFEKIELCLNHQLKIFESDNQIEEVKDFEHKIINVDCHD